MRLDAYVLIRLRTGTDRKRGHKDHPGFESRFHLSECSQYEEGRPDTATLFKDGFLNDWKTWWTKHDYLGVSVPTSLDEYLYTRVMCGNPFDHTITIERDGEVVIEQLRDLPCKGCDKVHRGQCTKIILNMMGRWFFCNEEETICRICNGNFGGGSVRRPGGSGLKDHLRRSKDTCGVQWEKIYWDQIVADKDSWDEVFRISIVLQWLEVFHGKRDTCTTCGKKYKDTRKLRIHLRQVMSCFEVEEREMFNTLAGQDVGI